MTKTCYCCRQFCGRVNICNRRGYGIVILENELMGAIKIV